MFRRPRRQRINSQTQPPFNSAAETQRRQGRQRQATLEQLEDRRMLSWLDDLGDQLESGAGTLLYCTVGTPGIAAGYTAGAAVMANRSKSTHPLPDVFLNAVRDTLGSYWYDIGKKVRAHWDVELLNKVGGVDWSEVFADEGVSDADAQVFGYDVYLEYDRPSVIFNKEITKTLVHELVHVEQYERLGKSLAAYGLAYAEGYLAGGCSYSSNWMEKEAENWAVRTWRRVFDKLWETPEAKPIGDTRPYVRGEKEWFDNQDQKFQWEMIGRVPDSVELVLWKSSGVDENGDEVYDIEVDRRHTMQGTIDFNAEGPGNYRALATTTTNLWENGKKKEHQSFVDFTVRDDDASEPMIALSPRDSEVEESSILFGTTNYSAKFPIQDFESQLITWEVSDVSGYGSEDDENRVGSLSIQLEQFLGDSFLGTPIEPVPQEPIGQFDLTAYPPGKYVLTIAARDDDQDWAGDSLPIEGDNNSPTDPLIVETREFLIEDDDDSAPRILFTTESGTTLRDRREITESHGVPNRIRWDASDESGFLSILARVWRDDTLLTPAPLEVHPRDSYSLDAYGPGNYRVELTATDDDDDGWEGDRRTRIQGAILEITNAPPTVSLEGDRYDLLEGQPLTLYADGRDLDPGDTETLDYSWDLNGDGQFGDASGKTPTVDWDSWVAAGVDDDGLYTVQVRVTDTYGETAQDSAVLVVRNAPPRLISFLSEPFIDENTDHQVTGLFEDPSPADTHDVIVHWGDGTSTAATIDQNAREFSASHRYVDDDPTGTPFDEYVIRVELTDDDGGLATDRSRTLEVENSTLGGIRLPSFPNRLQNLEVPVSGLLTSAHVEVDPQPALTSYVNGKSYNHSHTVDYPKTGPFDLPKVSATSTASATVDHRHSFHVDTVSKRFDKTEYEALFHGLSASKDRVYAMTPVETGGAASLPDGYQHQHESSSGNGVPFKTTTTFAYVDLDWTTIIDTDFKPFPSNARLNGDAYARNTSASSTVVRLTEPKFNEKGSLIINGTNQAYEAFEASFDLFIGRSQSHPGQGAGGDGFSFGLGPLSNSSLFGERGPKNQPGLWVLIDTFNNGDGDFGISVYYNGQRVKRWYSMSKSSLRPSKSVPMKVSVTEAGVVEIRHPGISSSGYKRFTLSNWNPQSNWRFGFGARCGGAASDFHSLRNLKIKAKVPFLFFDDVTKESNDSYVLPRFRNSGDLVYAQVKLDPGPANTDLEKANSFSHRHEFGRLDVGPFSFGSCGESTAACDNVQSTAGSAAARHRHSVDYALAGREFGEDSGELREYFMQESSTFFSQDKLTSTKVLGETHDLTAGTVRFDTNVKFTYDVDQTIVRVRNVAPEITSLDLVPSAVENSSVKLEGTFVDEGVGDTHRVLIAWGDGTSQELTVPAGDRLFAAEHQYLDDAPSGTVEDAYQVRVTILDDDGGSDDQIQELTVRNEPPQLTLAPPLPVAEGSEFPLPPATFTDRGLLDGHSASVRWGDGTPDDAATILQGAGAGIVIAEHVYRDEGTYALQVTLRDDDTGEVTVSQSVTVFNVAPTIDDVRALGPVIEGLAATFRASATDPGDDVVTYTWDFGDGTPPQSGVDLTEVSHVFGNEGTYTATLSVSDGDGGTASRQLTLIVPDVSSAVSVAGPTSIAEGADYPLTLGTLTDEAAASIVHWIIDWGDGTSSEYTQAGLVTHRYADGPGAHAIRIEVEQSSGGVSFIGELPVAVENVAPGVTSLTRVAGPPLLEGQTQSFTATAVDDGDDTLTYSWDFGDGSAARTGVDLTSVEHAYADNGEYFVTLTVRDEEGGEAVARIPVLIDNVPPAISVGGAGETVEGAPYELTLGSISDAGDDTVVSWIVDWGDGQMVRYDQGGTVVHAYPEGPNEHQIRVALEDEDGLHPFQQGPGVSVRNGDPVVHRINGALLGDEGQRFRLSADVTDPGGSFDVLTFVWNFGDGSTAQGINLSDVQHVYADNGTYDASLTVNDEEGGRQVFAFSVTVNNVAPRSILYGPDQVAEGTPYALKFGPIVEPGADSVTQWIVDWGDGDQSVVNVSDPSSVPGPISHVYSDGPANPQIVLKLVDEDGTHEPAATLAVDVQNAPPEIQHLDGTTRGLEGGEFQYEILVDEPGDDPLEFTWDFGDGTPPLVGVGLDHPSHVYADDGEYLITVTVDDGDGGQDSEYLPVRVNNVAPTIFIAGDSSVPESGNYALSLGQVTDPGDDTVGFWLVNWGDGSSDAYRDGGEVTHTYADSQANAEIQVSLVDEDGAHRDAGSVALDVINLPPEIIELSLPSEILEGLPAEFSLTATDPAGEFDPLVVSWEFGDGTPLENSAPGERVNHSFADDGVYQLRVTVSDGEGGEEIREVTIKVDNVAPTIALSGDVLANEGGPYTLTLGDVVDPGRDMVSSWIVDWGDGQVDAYSAPGDVQHTYADGGASPKITVSLIDEDGTHVAGEKTVEVLNLDPEIQTLTGRQQGVEGELFWFQGAATDPAGDADEAGYIWIFGDGTDLVYDLDLTDVTHQFNDNGVYRVGLNVRDEDGGSTLRWIDVAVENESPTFEAGAAETILPPTLGQFNRAINFADPGVPDVHDVTIDYGDGSEKHDFTLSDGERSFELDHKFGQSGTFTITVTVADRDGGTHTDSFDLTVILAEIEFTSATFVDLEGAGTSSVVTLERNSAIVESQVQVDVAGGTAVRGTDYDEVFPYVVSFPVDAFTANVAVPIVADDLVELDETVSLVVTAVSNATIVDQDTTTLTITNDDTAKVTIHESGYLEGDSGTNAAVFDVTISNPVDRPVTVVVETQSGVAVGGGVDYLDVSDHQLTFSPDGPLTETFEVRLVGDTDDEGDEAFTVHVAEPKFDGATDLGRAAVAVNSAAGVVENDDLGERQAVQIIDNGDPGFASAGFTFFGYGYQSDLHYATGDSTGDVATWTFDDLLPGLYRVSTTWSPHPTRATNALFTLTDGDVARGAIRVNQQLTPDDFADAGASWKDLGPYVKVIGGKLTVELSDQADQVVAADAVRVELLTHLSDYWGELTVLHDGGYHQFGDPIDFGRSAVSVARELTLRNDGGEPLALGGTNSSAAVFRAPLDKDVLAPGESTTWTIGMSDFELGEHAGTIQIVSDDVDEDPFTIPVSGEVYQFTSQTIDNGDAGFEASGFTAWPFGYQGDLHYATSGASDAHARWTFDGLPVGLYRVAATWSVSNDRAANAPFELWDDDALQATIPINQRSAPGDYVWDDASWGNLGSYVVVKSGTLAVQLAGNTEGVVDADAVRIERLTSLDDAEPEIQLVGEIGNVISGDAVSFGQIPAPKTFTFEIRNEGGAPLNLGQVASSSNQLVVTVADTEVPPGGATALTVTPVESLLGTFEATITIPNNDLDEATFAFAVKGDVAELRILDDDGPQFTSTSGFRRWSNQGYGGDVWEANPGELQSASWTLTDLPAGVYRISATWSAYYNRASNVAYSINGGETIAIDQRKSPSDPASTPQGTVVQDPDSGVHFADLSVVARPENGTISVRLTNDGADGNVIADAIRVERLGPLQTESTENVAHVASMLTHDQLTPVVDAAIGYWTAADPSAASRLTNVEVVIRDLPGSILGLASPLSRTIWLDDDGGRLGWRMDAARQVDTAAQRTSNLGRFDLLTTVMHELGHLLGLPDLDPVEHPGALMAATLPPGERRWPQDLPMWTESNAPIDEAFGSEVNAWRPAAADDWFHQLGNDRKAKPRAHTNELDEVCAAWSTEARRMGGHRVENALLEAGGNDEPSQADGEAIWDEYWEVDGDERG